MDGTRLRGCQLFRKAGDPDWWKSHGSARPAMISASAAYISGPTKENPAIMAGFVRVEYMCAPKGDLGTDHVTTMIPRPLTSQERGSRW